MLQWLKRLFAQRNCAMCGRKAHTPRHYINDKGKSIVVCPMCVEYAERRAYRRR